ncbi:MAG TPA: endo-1,4-beta-xylanase [Caulobacteraceae bacterium]
MTWSTRREVIGSALALAACERPGASRAFESSPQPLKSVAPFPVGVAVQAEQLGVPSLAALIASQFSQLTPEWQMKMEYILQGDGSLRFTAPDAIADFAAHRGLRLFGHTLVWHAQRPAAFLGLDPNRATFHQAFANYIAQVVGRYRGRCVGWDVVNEAVAEDGNGWRDSLWSERLGAFEHIRLAFELARRADPDAVLLLNDYNLESIPAKRATFMRLAEALLNAGAPLGGLGSQTHVNTDLADGAITTTVRDLARLGLPIHISEMDVSSARMRGLTIPGLDQGSRRDALYAEAAGALMELPSAQRFAMTVWGLRDRDSWLLRRNADDAPLLFDNSLRAKPALAAIEAALKP